MRKKSSSFQFRQFEVHHDRCAMKVGTDAVLIGAWANMQQARHILDIGTGCGIIALMMAQRSNSQTHIDAVEIEEKEARQATDNIDRSPWPDKISVHCTAIQDFHSPYRYDLIISNPPFFVNSLLPPEAKRRTARHTSLLTHDEMIRHACRLLSDDGRLALILPVQEGNAFKEAAAKEELHCIRQLAFYSRKEKLQERSLFEFSPSFAPIQNETLTLYEQQNEWSAAYRVLTQEFYL